MLKRIKATLGLYLDDLLLIAGGVCLSRAAAMVCLALGWGAAGAIWYGLLVARAGAGRWRK